MRVNALKLALAAALTALASGLAPVDASADAESELGMLFGILFTDEELTGNRQDANDASPLIGLRGALRMQRWGLFADGVISPIEPPFPLDDGHELLLRGGLEVFGPPYWGSGESFLAGSVGLMHLGLDDEDSLNKLMLSAGVGQTFQVTDRGRLRWEFRGEHVFVGDDEIIEDDMNQFELLFGASVSFGSGSAGDEDEDGVADDADDCPNTPLGWPVDRRGCPLDSDHDGVPDGIDECPGTPEGATVDKRGCPSDSDGDGVFNGIDECPNTPAGVAVDEIGCPLDSDGDGVPDGVDKCPDTPKKVKVDAKGCPLAAPLFTPDKKALILEGVNFETNSEKLTEDSRATLDRVAESLRAYPDVRVEIGGHTDSRNTEAYNLDLSRRRAESVKAYLVSEGVEAKQLETMGYGEAKPIATNKTIVGMARNRRVELKKID